jgi:pimeloyl-ACP methyl ester carboxylesterase
MVSLNTGRDDFGIARFSLPFVPKCAVLVAIACFTLAPSRTASAQVPVRAAAPAQPPVAVPVVPPRKPLPAAQPVALKTRDGVQLAATFYPSNAAKEVQKDSVPVIMLHGYKGSRADFNDLAQMLQGVGCAVLVPDLRGHGESTRRLMPDGKEQKINLALFNRADLEAMVEYDVEACESFLIDKNNAKELNIDKLCVVGAEMGSTIAVNWAKWNWHWPMLSTGKQGQDVKGLVLLSPTWAFKGLPISGVVSDRDFSTQLAWMILVGEQEPKELAEAKRLYQTLDKLFPNDPTAKTGLVFKPLPTSLQGTKLLAKNLNASGEIVKFIDLIAKKPNAWAERKIQ